LRVEPPPLPLDLAFEGADLRHGLDDYARKPPPGLLAQMEPRDFRRDLQARARHAAFESKRFLRPRAAPERLLALQLLPPRAHAPHPTAAPAQNPRRPGRGLRPPPARALPRPRGAPPPPRARRLWGAGVRPGLGPRRGHGECVRPPPALRRSSAALRWRSASA